jgi:hypothetical protein
VKHHFDAHFWGSAFHLPPPLHPKNFPKVLINGVRRQFDKTRGHIFPLTQIQATVNDVCFGRECMAPPCIRVAFAAKAPFLSFLSLIFMFMFSRVASPLLPLLDGKCNLSNNHLTWVTHKTGKHKNT